MKKDFEKRNKDPWEIACLIGAVLGFAGMIFNWAVDLIASNMVRSEAHSVGIIGSADGPTAIFVTTTGPDWEFILFFAIFCLGVAGYFWQRKGRK